MKTALISRLVFCALVSFFLLFTGACKKNEDTPGNGSGYYMKFKLNGTQVEYTGQVEGNFNKPTASSYAASFSGLKETLVASKNNMSIIVGTDAENKTGTTYTTYTASGASEKAKVLSLVYFDDAGISYLSWQEEFASAIPAGTKIDGQLTVTETTSAAIKGTFSGTLYNNDFTKSIAVTNGEFFVRRIN